jgi:hypothetical protein
MACFVARFDPAQPTLLLAFMETKHKKLSAGLQAALVTDARVLSAVIHKKITLRWQKSETRSWQRIHTRFKTRGYGVIMLPDLV